MKPTPTPTMPDVLSAFCDSIAPKSIFDTPEIDALLAEMRAENEGDEG